jgi:hypothetical protein
VLRINLILDTDKANPKMVELLQSLEEMGYTPRKAIELPYQYTGKGMVTGRSHQRLELRPALLASRDGAIQILCNDLQPGTRGIAVEAVGLEIRLLVVCGDA